MADDLFEQIERFLPKYLTPRDRQDLFDALKQFPANKNFYLTAQSPAELLQGDGWQGLIAIDFLTLEKKVVSGVLLSNSCDIEVGNPRSVPTKILFAPIIKLNNFTALLTQSGKPTDQIMILWQAFALKR